RYNTPMPHLPPLSGTGGEILARSLAAQGADHLFCVPGESHLALLDALYDAQDQIRVIVCRHEGGAANMADAYGKLTGRPGIVLVTRGPARPTPRWESTPPSRTRRRSCSSSAR